MRQDHHEHPPGEPAPASGRYEEVNVFGALTGRVAYVKEGEELPAAPRGFMWRRATVPSATSTYGYSLVSLAPGA
jgi:hypothetical protein